MKKKSSIRRINIFGGAGAGKSTLAAEIFADQKRANRNCDLVTEFAKELAWDDHKPEDFDQFWIFGKQMKREFRRLKGGADFIITDSPLLLSAVYAKLNGICSDYFACPEQDFSKQYPDLNIVISRGNKPYNPKGRWGSRKDAVKIDRKIIDMLHDADKDYFLFEHGSLGAVKQLVEDYLWNQREANKKWYETNHYMGDL